jgi:hypothetical protein
MDALHVDWYDWVLGRGPKPAFLRDRVAYFMMGADEWRYAKTLEAASSGINLTLYLSDSAERRGTYSTLARSCKARLARNRLRLLWMIHTSYPNSKSPSTLKMRI